MSEASVAYHLWPPEQVGASPEFREMQHAMGRLALRLTDDPYGRSYLQAAQESIDNDTLYGRSLKQFVALRGIKMAPRDKGLTTSNAININRSIAHAYYLDKYGDRFYEGLETPEGWAELDEVAKAIHSHYEHGELTEHLPLYYRSGRSNTSMGQRYGLLDLYLQIHREELGDSVSMLDVGPGLLIGSKQLAHKDQFPFENIEVVAGNINRQAIDDDRQYSADLTEKVSGDLLQRPSQVDVSHGVDLDDPTAPITRRWGYACLRIKGELNNPEFMHRYNEIANLPTSKVDHVVCDFSNFASMRKFNEKFPDKKYDVIFLSMVKHQVTSEEFTNMLAMARTLGKPKSESSPGVKILVFDFAYGPNMDTYLDWYRRPYRAHLFEVDPETGRGTEVLRSYDGRGRKIAVYAGKTAVKGRYMPTADAIMAA